MIGYHFTVGRNLPSILEQGMQPYPLNKPEIHGWYTDPNGVFIFPDDCENDLDRIGCVYFQAVTKKDFKVIELEIEYETEDLKPLRYPLVPGDVLTIGHTGTLGLEWVYHVRPLVVLSGPIPPERVQLRATYDLRDILVSAPGRTPVKAFA